MEQIQALFNVPSNKDPHPGFSVNVLRPNLRFFGYLQAIPMPHWRGALRAPIRAERLADRLGRLVGTSALGRGGPTGPTGSTGIGARGAAWPASL